MRAGFVIPRYEDGRSLVWMDMQPQGYGSAKHADAFFHRRGEVAPQDRAVATERHDSRMLCWLDKTTLAPPELRKKTVSQIPATSNSKEGFRADMSK